MVNKSKVELILNRKIENYLTNNSNSMEDWELGERANEVLWLFDIIVWNKVEYGSSINEWKHQSSSNLDENLKYLSISREDLKKISSVYIDNSWMHCKELDWLFADVLIYSEVVAFYSEILKAKMGFKKYYSYVEDSKSSIVRFKDISRNGLVYFTFVFFCIACLFISWEFALVAIGCFIYWQYQVFQSKKEVDKILYYMNRSYQFFEDEVVSWNMGWNELNSSRDVGVVWDSQLYQLVELRMNSPLDT